LTTVLLSLRTFDSWANVVQLPNPSQFPNKTSNLLDLGIIYFMALILLPLYPFPLLLLMYTFLSHLIPRSRDGLLLPVGIGRDPGCVRTHSLSPFSLSVQPKRERRQPNLEQEPSVRSSTALRHRRSFDGPFLAFPLATFFPTPFPGPVLSGISRG